jgi:Tol biopolymer transport system component
MDRARPKPIGFSQDRVESWKEIARYLRKDLRTVQRWEKLYGLPVHRSPSGAVYAITSELDRWKAGGATAQSGSDGHVAQQTISEIPEPATSRQGIPSAGSRWWLIGAAVLSVCVLSIASWYLLARGSRRGRVVITPITSHGPGNFVTAASLSRNGELFAWSGAGGIHLKNLLDGRARRLRGPSDYVPDRLAWFPDNRKILCSGRSATDERPSVWLIDSAGGLPLMIRSDARGAIPSPDGLKILFLSSDNSEIWVMGPQGEQPRRILGPSGSTITTAFWSPTGCCVMVQRRDTPLHEQPGTPDATGAVAFHFDTVDIESGTTVNSLPNFQVVSGWSCPDGRVFLVTADSGLKFGIWEVKTNLISGAFLSAPRHLADLTHTERVTVNATDTGDKLLLLRTREQTDTYIADWDSQGPRLKDAQRVGLDGFENYPRAWTPDSKGIIFESLRNTHELYVKHLDRDTAQQLLAKSESDVMAQVSPSGNFVLFASIPNFAHKEEGGLWRVPLTGGRAVAVPASQPLDEFRCAKQPGKSCVMRSAIGREWYVFYRLDPVSGQGSELARTAWTHSDPGDWDLSMDGSTIAIPYHGGESARVRLVSLDGRGQRELTIPDLPGLQSVAWDSFGKGFFASVTARPLGTELYWVDLSGRSHLLHRTVHESSPVPSPDGTRLAFVDRTRDQNAWLMEWR